MATPTINRFLVEIAGFLRTKNGTKIQDFMLLEPPLPPQYDLIVNELRQSFPETHQDALEAKCRSLFPEDEESDDGGSPAAFIGFTTKYFAFLRDVDVNDLVETHEMLKALLNQGILALSSSIGLVVLPTIISLSRTLARLAIGLDKRPDLIAHLTRRESTIGREEAAERVTLVEGSANVIREAFKKCLSERSGPVSGVDGDGKPEGRRVGIYITANLCLQLFFHCRKLRSAEQIFGNIYQQSPPLALFPASQRVTYLYYLGRYLFANSHFFRAQLALQAAYDQCHHRCLKQRRLILIYLITSNIILGRFPTPKLLRRQEAAGLADKFLPLCSSIAAGNLTSFRRLLSLDAENAGWLLCKRILLQLSNRCEIIVWRSLARKTFILSGSQGDSSNKKAPTLDLKDLLTLAIHLESEVLNPSLSNVMLRVRPHHTNALFRSSSAPPPLQINGYTDPDLLSPDLPSSFPDLPVMPVIESILASLIDQGLLHGFISHRIQRFAITGAKSMGALQAGFPNVWEVIYEKADKEVPGWVTREKVGGFGGVINLSGVRPVGVQSG